MYFEYLKLLSGLDPYYSIVVSMNMSYEIALDYLTLISVTPPSSIPLPVPIATFDALVHGIAHLIACFSVTISLMLCMAAVLFSCLCLFELAIQCINEAARFIRGGEDKIF